MDDRDPKHNTEEPRSALRFDLPWKRFTTTIDTLRELHAAASPRAAELDARALTPEALAAVTALTRQRRDQLAAFLGRFGEPHRIEIGPPPSPEERDGVNEELSRELNDIFRDNPAAQREWGKLMRDSALAPRKRAVLNGAVLTMAVSAFEVLLGGLATDYYLIHPGALGGEREFSLADLEAFDSVADAREASVANRVESLLRGSLEDWEAWLDKALHLKVENLAIDHDELREVFQRRHVIVHNAGRASRRYIKLAPGGDHVQLDSDLPVTDDYLETALDGLETLGNLLSAGAWSKALPHQEEAALSELHDEIFDLMVEGRWRAVEKLSSVGELLDCSDSLKLVFRANRLLAMKRIQGTEVMRAKLNEWDTSALAPAFKLVAAALDDDFDRAFEIAEDLAGTPFLSQTALTTWPVLEEMRLDPRFEALLERYENEASANKRVLEVIEGGRPADQSSEEPGEPPGHASREGTAALGAVEQIASPSHWLEGQGDSAFKPAQQQDVMPLAPVDRVTARDEEAQTGESMPSADKEQTT
jgi:hypothetical protein